MSFSALESKIKEKNCRVVVGLDPKLDSLPQHILDKSKDIYGVNKKSAAEALYFFNKELIDNISDIAPAIKPQSAYYEMLGPTGVYVLYKTILYAKEKGMYVIMDGKRNDIGSTAEAYSSAYLGKSDFWGKYEESFNADSLTVNPYLGFDGIEPFINDCTKYDKSIFVLVKTSNKSSGDFQDIILRDSGEPMYKHIAAKVSAWGRSAMKDGDKYSPVGAVVGATYPEQLRELREMMPETFFLVPGYGAQGAGADDVKYAFAKDGSGAIVNSSRAVMYAYKTKNAPENFGLCAREEVISMRDAINKVIGATD